MGAEVLVAGAAGYPARLINALCGNAPPVLYAKGNLELLNAPSFAIIGTRRPSKVGRESARQYAKAMVSAGYAIVSGNAPGIDAAGHEETLRVGGGTIVFPPTPLDQFHASFHVPQGCRDIAVLSPFAPGSETEPWCFLQRNSLVAALCVGALVAETGTRGGTLDTVRKLRALGRPLWATELNADAKHFNAHRMLISGGAQGVPLVSSPGNVLKIVKALRSKCKVSCRRNEQQFMFGDTE
jgi:DNA processing protein